MIKDWVLNAATSRAGRELEDRHVAITGALTLSRADMVALIEACGAKWDKSVRATTEILVVGDTGEHGRTAKIRAAEERGIRIISESQLVSMLES